MTTAEPPEVQLVPLRPEDEWVTAALETDPDMMAHLGGPLDPAAVPGSLPLVGTSSEPSIGSPGSCGQRKRDAPMCASLSSRWSRSS